MEVKPELRFIGTYISKTKKSKGMYEASVFSKNGEGFFVLKFKNQKDLVVNFTKENYDQVKRDLEKYLYSMDNEIYTKEDIEKNLKSLNL